jgi:hypothetical protein
MSLKSPGITHETDSQALLMSSNSKLFLDTEENLVMLFRSALQAASRKRPTRPFEQITTGEQ